MGNEQEPTPEEDPDDRLHLLIVLGLVAVNGFERDTFADDIQGHLTEYPENAP